MFRNVGMASGGIRPQFGASLVPSRTQTITLPTLVASVNTGDPQVKGVEILADQSGAKPLSAITWSAPATAAGTAIAYVKFRVYVGPEDVGKMFLADVLADLTVTGADSQRVSYITFPAHNDAQLMAAEAAIAPVTVPQGTTLKAPLVITYSQLKVPAGTHYAEVALHLTKIRNGDSWTIYHPQVNVV